MARLSDRLARLERGAGDDRASVAWLAVRRWLGEALPPERLNRLALHEGTQPAYDPTAPVDATGWSADARSWWNGTLDSPDDPRWVPLN